MDQLVEQRIRALARPLWESAARPYGVAMDFWLMAEQMVLEMMAVTTRVQSTAIEMPRQRTDLPEAMPVDQVRQLAEYMWESAGRQYGMAQDFWLAAERHVMAMMRAAAATSPAGEAVEPWIRELPRLSPAAYMEQIQAAAHNLWEAAGRQYGCALDFWLEAEKQTLATLARMSAAPPPPSDEVVAEAHERQRRRQATMATQQQAEAEDGRDRAAAEAASPAATKPAAAEPVKTAEVEAASPPRKRPTTAAKRRRLALTEDVPPSAR